MQCQTYCHSLPKPGRTVTSLRTLGQRAQPLPERLVRPAQQVALPGQARQRAAAAAAAARPRPRPLPPPRGP